MWKRLNVAENYLWLFAVPAMFFLLNPAKFCADDGFFYPQIAHNLVNGLGFHFNDVYSTNGFHPLWMVVCIILDFILPFSKQGMIYVLWMVQVVLFFGSLSKLRPFFRYGTWGEMLAVAFLTLVFFSLGTLYLTEAHLNLFCIALLLNLLTKIKTVDGWTLGLAASLVFLSRLDNVFVLLFLGLYCLTSSERPKIKDLLKAIGVCTLLLGSYLFYNYVEFGNVIPVSGRIKSNFPYAEGSLLGNKWGSLFFGFNLVYAVMLLFCKVDFRKLKLYFVLGALLQLVYNLYFQSQIGQWYFVMQMLAVAFMASDIWELLFSKYTKQNFSTLKLIGGLVLVGGLSGVAFLKASTNLSLGYNIDGSHEAIKVVQADRIQSLAEDLKKILPPGSRVFTYDMPGKLAIYSDLEIVPADGLVADESYFDKIKTLPFEEFLKENKIDYVLLPTRFEKDGTRTFIGIQAMQQNGQISYQIRSSWLKQNVGPVTVSQFDTVKIYPNPLKVWQPDYDNVVLLKLKNTE